MVRCPYKYLSCSKRKFVDTYYVCHVVVYTLAKPCTTLDRMYMKPEPNFEYHIFVYEFFYKERDNIFPLSNFEAQILIFMNVAPCELHLNSWAFLKYFQIIFHQLHMEPTLNKFTYFYQLKYGKLIDLVSFNGAQYGALFTLYQSSYKYFKTKFFKLKCASRDEKKYLFFYKDFHPRFPMYW